jgi:hypothetical protein
MSLKDKLEIGLKPDAPYRPDNLPEFQQDDPSCRKGSTPGHAVSVDEARDDCDDGIPTPRVAAKRKAAATTSRRAAPSRAAVAPRRATKARPPARTKRALRERSGRGKA